MDTQLLIVVIIFAVLITAALVISIIALIRQRQEQLARLNDPSLHHILPKTDKKKESNSNIFDNFIKQNLISIEDKLNKYLTDYCKDEIKYTEEQIIEKYSKTIKFLQENQTDAKFTNKLSDILESYKQNYNEYQIGKINMVKRFYTWNYPLEEFVDLLYNICKILYGDRDFKILEIAAGYGFISKFITVISNAKKYKIKMNATDSGDETSKGYDLLYDILVTKHDALKSLDVDISSGSQILLVSRGRAFMNRELLVKWINANIYKVIVLILLTEGNNTSCEPPQFFEALKTLKFKDYTPQNELLLPFNGHIDHVQIYTRFNDLII